MRAVALNEIQHNLLAYLPFIEAGETLLIMQNNRPVAEIKLPDSHHKISQRPSALCQGEFVVPDDFDSPLPDDVLNAFEGKT